MGSFLRPIWARQQVLGQPARDPPGAVEAIGGATHAIVHPAAWPNDTGKVIRGWLDSLGATLIAEVDGAAVYELPVKEALARAAKKEGPQAMPVRPLGPV